MPGAVVSLFDGKNIHNPSTNPMYGAFAVMCNFVSSQLALGELSTAAVLQRHL